MQDKFLHIASDEKFIEAAWWLFEKSFPGKNSYLIILPNKKHKLKYIEKKDVFHFIYKNEKPVESILDHIETNQLVILHNLDIIKSKVVLNSNDKNNKFLWLFWGSEVYDNPRIFSNDFIGQSTRKKFYLESYKLHLKNIFRPVFYHLYKNTVDRFSTILEAGKKVHYFGVPFKEEFDLMIKLNVLNKNCKYVKFAYYPLEFIFSKSVELKINNNNILIGNSSSLTNNHLESFEYLKKIDIGSRKLIVPLSYGDKKYRDKIIQVGSTMFNDNFKPLVDFMNLRDYNKTLQTCSIIILNHYRQQAFGTMVSMLWMGAKVFLSKKNTIYSYLKRIGVYIYSIEEDLTNDKDTLSPLGESAIIHNRNILKMEISAERLVKSLQENL